MPSHSPLPAGPFPHGLVVPELSLWFDLLHARGCMIVVLAGLQDRAAQTNLHTGVVQVDRRLTPTQVRASLVHEWEHLADPDCHDDHEIELRAATRLIPAHDALAVAAGADPVAVASRLGVDVAMLRARVAQIGPGGEVAAVVAS